jgi:hypothetical protein
MVDAISISWILGEQIGVCEVIRQELREQGKAQCSSPQAGMFFAGAESALTLLRTHLQAVAKRGDYALTDIERAQRWQEDVKELVRLQVETVELLEPIFRGEATAEDMAHIGETLQKWGERTKKTEGKSDEEI